MAGSTGTTRRRWLLLAAIVFAAAAVLYGAAWMYYVRQPPPPQSAVELGFQNNCRRDLGGDLITSVVRDSPAERAGLKANDCIVAVNGNQPGSFDCARDRDLRFTALTRCPRP